MFASNLREILNCALCVRALARVCERGDGVGVVRMVTVSKVGLEVTY